MAIKLNERNHGKLLEVQVSGKLAHEDYQQFVPKFEEMIKRHGKVSVLFDMVDFHGWEAGALWDDIKFDARHFADIERLALIGDKKWEKGMSVFCRPFTTAQVRFFDRAESAAALAWAEGT
jgi:hypothetical protein